MFWLVLTCSTYSSGSPSVTPTGRLTIATSQNPVLFTAIGQSILLETAFPAGINVYTPGIDVYTLIIDVYTLRIDVYTLIYSWLPSWWFLIKCPTFPA